MGLVGVASRRRRTEVLLHLRLLGVVGVAYLIPTLNAVKTLGFGLGFQTLLMVWTLLALAPLLRVRPREDTRSGGWSRAALAPTAAPTAALIAAAVAGVLLIDPDPAVMGNQPRR